MYEVSVSTVYDIPVYDISAYGLAVYEITNHAVQTRKGHNEQIADKFGMRIHKKATKATYGGLAGNCW